MNVIFPTVKAVNFVFEIDSPTFINYIQIIIGMFTLFFVLVTILEICLVKLWIEFVWKSVRCVNDQFLVTFILIMNTMIGIIYTISNAILESTNTNSILLKPGFWMEKYSAQIK